MLLRDADTVSATEYRLDLFEKQPDGSWKHTLMERFDAAFTSEVLAMVAHETGYGQEAFTDEVRAARGLPT